MHARTTALVAAGFFASASAAPAQTTCFDFGSVPVAASWQASPSSLGCGTLPNWPQWHLFTPAHRAPAPHVGFAPRDARELPRILVHYRCTGLLLIPVVVDRVRYMGYVIDQPEVPCGGTTP